MLEDESQETETLNFCKSKEVNSMSIYKSDKGKEAILSLYERQLERLDKKFEDIFYFDE